MSGGERRRISKWDLEDGSERVHQPSSVDDDFQKKSRELDKNRDSESNFNAGSNNDPKSHVGGEAYNEFGGEVSDASMPWESDTRISPSGGDDLKQRRPNRSRRRSRSRSRSPASDFNRESKSYVRSSERPQHYDKKNSEDRKRYSGGGTQRDEEASGYYAVSDDSWENPSQIGRFATITTANSNSNVCNNFLKGRCFRGESCRYSHHNVVVSGDGISKGSSDESLKARELVRRNRGGDIQCKFYAAGNCRNGKLCRFSHDDVSQDDWKVRGGKNMDQEREPNLHMDNRSRAHAVEIDRAEQRKESGYNHQHRRHPLAKETSRGRMEVSDSKGAENSVMEDNNEFSEHLNVETGLPFMSHYSSVAQKKPNFDDKQGSIDHNFSSAASVPETPSLDLNNHQNSSALFGLNPVGQNQQPIAASLRAPVEELDPGTKNTVSREQLSQLTNLSVSLAQFFGSGQQLPLLYAALNGSNSAAAAVPNQPQTEYLPVTEAVDLSKPNTTRDEPNKKPTDAVDETMLSEKKKDKAGGGPAEKLDGDGKDNNNGKGTRAFKFALVEFVKELLKPTWKEGQLSKEDHKTIVKKVVDKVTGSIQGVHIPQSQEKIDNYLSSSKPKLSKLVQAYVEKYKKS